MVSLRPRRVRGAPPGAGRLRPSSPGYLIGGVATRPADSLGTKDRFSPFTCGAKGTRTPGLLHAMQAKPVAGCGWKWLCQQCQSLHVACDSPLLPPACSPSCSPVDFV